MNRYWKYHLGLVGQILVASIVYGAFVAALVYYKPAPAWQDNPLQSAWTLGLMSATAAAILGLVILGAFVVRDKIKDKTSNS